MTRSSPSTPTPPSRWGAASPSPWRPRSRLQASSAPRPQGGGTFTNLLDESVIAVVDYFFLVQAVVSLEGPSESGRAQAAFDLFVDGAREDRGRAEVELASSECVDFFPCDLEDIDPGAFAVGFELGPNETVPFSYTASALAVAPIPLPAALGPAALALGGLAWAGRRKRRR